MSMINIVQLLCLCALPLPTVSFLIVPPARAHATTASIRIGSGSTEVVSDPHRNPNRGAHHMVGIGDEGGPSPGGDAMRILGVCGGIGSGKSTACRLMVESLGCAARVDADKLAHAVYEPGSKALDEIAEEFGKDVLNDSGLVDRKKLGAIVFSNAQSMSKLELIVWPHVREKIEERIRDIKQEHELSVSDSNNGNVIIVEAALLLETDWHDLLDGLWIVRSSPSVATRRLVDDRGLTEEEALVRIRAQETRRGIGGLEDGTCKEMEEGKVTAVIANDGTLEELERSLKEALSDPLSFKDKIAGKVEV